MNTTKATTRICTSTLIFLVLSCLASSTLLAQEVRRYSGAIKLKPKPGEEIEAYYFGAWRPAAVIEVSGNNVLVEIEFGRSWTEKTLKVSETRYPWQAKAISPVFVWKDKSGTFSVKAAVLDIDRESTKHEGGSITLYRLDNDQEVTLPINKLSESDQRRVEVIAKNSGLRLTEAAPVEQFSTAKLKQPSQWNSDVDLANVPPDPPAIEMNIPSGGAAFPKMHYSDSLLSIYPIGTETGWIAAATGSESWGKDQFPGRLVWGTIKDGKIRKQQAIENGEKLVAVDASSQRVLTVGKTERQKMTLTLLSASPKTDRAKPIVRWISSSGLFGGDQFADFVDRNRIIHRWAKARYVVWDIESRSAVFEIKQESFRESPPTISPGKRYLALPEDGQIRIISARDGVTLATLPIEGGRATGAAFNATGEKLAVLTNGQLAIWSLGFSGEPERVRADSMGPSYGRQLDWVDDRSLLVGGTTLFDLDKELPVWRYIAKSSEVVVARRGSRLTSIVDGRLCYGVSVKDRKNQFFVIGAVKLPGDGVREVVDRVDTTKLYAMQRGTPVQIKTNCGAHNSQVRSVLHSIAQSNGWPIESNADFILAAEVGRNKPQTVTYETIGGGQTHTVTVAPYFSNLKIEQPSLDRSIWSRGTSGRGAPPFMWVKSGESIQSKIRETENPDLEFFKNAEIPESIFDSRFRSGFGSSVYGKLGLSAEPLEDLPLLSDQ